MKASLATLGLWTLAIAAVGLGIYALAEAIETTAEKTKHLQEQQEQLKTQYDEARNSITELKSSFKQLDDLGDTLKSLTQGTEEWQQNLQDINFQVLQLLEKYPELAGEIENVNGKLTISAAGQERFIEAQQNRANDLAKGYYAATMAKNRQDYENAVTDFRTNKFDSSEFVASEAVVKKVVQEVANGNSAILGDRDALFNLLGGMASGEVLDFIQENTTELQNLAVKLQANTESQSLLAA
jgi:chromosome segregation ATPase